MFKGICKSRFAKVLKALFFLVFFTACTSSAYREHYAHLRVDTKTLSPMHETDYFVVLLVNARHLDYRSETMFIKTMQKHPDDWGKQGDVGHAWIYLKGRDEILEGGHTGDFGSIQAKYFDGVMNYIDFGYANPTYEQLAAPVFEPNPIKYLWESQQDGIFHKGSGGHRPTFAIKIDLNPDSYAQIKTYVDTYNYSDYALTGNQCSSFVAQVAAIAGLPLDSEVALPIHSTLDFLGKRYTLWRDAKYSSLIISTPDVLERSMIQAVVEGRAEYALPWYRSNQKFTRAAF